MAVRMQNAARRGSFGVAKIMGMALVVISSACATSVPAKPPAGPLITGEPGWPEDIMREVERTDRVCNQRETALRFEQEEAKKKKDKFKTVMGSITGGVGTVGGAVGGIGAFVIDSPDTLKQVAGITGIVTAGLGAVGSVLTLVVAPGEAQLKSISASLEAIEQKKEAARVVLVKKDPSTWSEEDKAAWAKAQQDLAAACK